MSHGPRRRAFQVPHSDPRATVDEEIAFHIEESVRELVAAGATPAAAREQALRKFGAMASVREECIAIEQRRLRRASLTDFAMTVVHDLRYALRTLRRSPGFTAAAVMCVALGIAVATTVFSAVNAVLIQPLPFVRPHELVAVYSKNRDERGVNISYPDFLSWRNENRTFAGMEMWTGAGMTLSGGDAERVDGSLVTAGLFDLLGVRPMLGSGFTVGDETRERGNVVMLSHGLWQRRFGADPTIVGRLITVNEEPHIVVGVMPRGFAFPAAGEAWRPLVVDASRERHNNRYFAGAIGRMKPGVTIDHAQRDLSAIMARIATDYPDQGTGYDADVMSLREDLVGDLQRPLLVFSGAVLLVLLVACANVANLLLARGASRSRELAVRTALGAGRGRIVRQLLTESVLLAVLGGAVGAALSLYGVRLLRLAFPGSVPYYMPIELDAVTMAFAGIASLITGVIFGVVPAFQATAGSIESVLREGSRAGTGSRARGRMRDALVVAELAVSVILMVGAGLLLKSYRALESTRLGFSAENALTFRVSLPPSAYSTRESRLNYMTALLERVRALPEVSAVGSANGTPFSGWNASSKVQVDGREPPRPGEGITTHFQHISPEYLGALGVPLLRGRGLTATDRDSLAPVVVVNATFVKRVFPNEDPLGKRVRVGGVNTRNPWATIVGTVADFRHYRLPEAVPPAMFFPYATAPLSHQRLLVRSATGDVERLIPAIRRVAAEIDPGVPIYNVQTMESVVAGMLWRERLQGQIIGLFAILALVLAAVGIYGVISYGVAQRTREFGIRIALGAQPQAVVGMVVRQGARLALLGVIIGVLGALGLTRVLASLLYDVKPTDPAVFVSVPLALASVALVATWLPARRATQADPLVALRSD